MEHSDSTEVIIKMESLPRKMKRKLNFALVFAICLCVILLIACIVLAALYSRLLNKNDATKYEICGDAHCLFLGLEMMNNMNKSVDPCDDFYAYACGGWQSRHPLVNNTVYSSVFTVVADENYNVIKKALERATVSYSKNNAVMKMVRFYRSCMNITAIDALGLQPLYDLIKQYGGWSISQNYDPNVTVAQRIGRAARDLNIDSLFGMDVIPNVYNTDINVLMLKESTLGLKKRYYLDLDEDSEKKRKNYKNYMKDVSRIFKAPYAKMEAIYDLEVKLAKILSGKSSHSALMDYIRKISMTSRTKRHAYDGTIKLSTLCQRTGFPWPVLKEALEVLFDRRLTGNEKIIPYDVDIAFLKAISTLYNKTNHALLADYIMWQVVRKYVGVLPDQYRPTVEDDLLSRVYYSRWRQCIKAMGEPFDMPVSLLFVDAHFNDDARVAIKEIIEHARALFIQRLPTQTWLDKETQEMAKQKALAIGAQDIGYPTYIKDPAKLNAQYDSLNVTDSLMDNMKAANHFYRMRTLKNFQRPVEKTDYTSRWTFGIPYEANSYYDSSWNRIIILAGMIQKPFYSPNYPRYMNYGGIGETVGHEITHAFDGTGRLYDKNGNFDNWWSPWSEANFKSKSMCFVKQYNKFKIFDKHENGSKTLDENIADNGGIKLAYDAYQRWTKKNGNEKILPGVELNPNQLFFLSYAQSSCTVNSKYSAYYQLDSDDGHSMAKYRVIGSLSNFKKFSEAFKCLPNSRMNPVDKCAIW